MTRRSLPNRRNQISATLEWPEYSGREIVVSVGFAQDGTGREVFARLKRPGSDLDAALDDWGVTVSRALQFGDRLQDVARGLSRPDSMLGAVAALAAQIEQERGAP